MDQRLLFKLFLVHASEETQRALLTYTIEYLKWRYNVKTLEEVKTALAASNCSVLLETCQQVERKAMER